MTYGSQRRKAYRSRWSPAGTPDASVVAIKRVDELGYYNLGLRELAIHVGLSQPKALALVRHLKLQEDSDCFKIFKISTQPIKRYSQQAIKKLSETLKDVDLEAVWKANKPTKCRSQEGKVNVASTPEQPQVASRA